MRFIRLDVSRCVAIVLLLVAHISQSVGSKLGGFGGIVNFYWVSLGGLAVTIFLILSGEVLHLKYGRSGIDFKSFILRRMSRIYPAYYISIVLGVGVYFAKSWYFDGSASAGLADLGVSDIVLSVFGCYAFVGRWGGPFNAVTWYIGLIMVLYLSFPILSAAARKAPNCFIVSVFLISFISRLVIGRYGLLHGRPLDWFPLCRIFEFSLGIYLAQMLPTSSLYIPRLTSWLRSCIYYVGDLSFYIYLSHYPLLGIIPFIKIKGRIPESMSIIIYLGMVVLLSWLIMKVDRKIPRRL